MALVVAGTTVTGTQVLDATKLSGNLPALNGSSLTNLAAMSTAPTTGTWTPAVSSGGITSVSGKYQKFGQIVYCQCSYVWNSSPSGDNATFWYWSGLPFTALNIGTDWLLGDMRFAGPDGVKMNGQYGAYIPHNSDRIVFVRTIGSSGSAEGNYDVNGHAASFNINEAKDIDGSANAYNYLSLYYISAS